MGDEPLTATRVSLHAVAELLLAGPQHAASGKIALRARPGGFGTTLDPDVRVDGTDLRAGERSVPIQGRTALELGEEIGIRPVGLGEVYSDGSGIDVEHRLDVDEAAAARIARAYAVGDQALRSLGGAPILWPEHFDIGITLEAERVNLGVSPGDAVLGAPYMYVGPWEPPAADGFWNQPFGAARELADDVDDVLAFFDEGRVRLGR